MSEKEREEERASCIPALEIRCERCDGRGRVGNPREDCVVCSGSGFELTEFGEKVLRLMRHRLRPLFRELISGE